MVDNGENNDNSNLEDTRAALRDGLREEVRIELFELATLEAMGVLDEVDSARMRRSFLVATPRLQEEIRLLQEVVALDPSLRSSEQPPEELRLKTIVRVLQAVDEDLAKSAPIAVIRPATGRATAAAQQSSRSATHSVEELLRELAARSAQSVQPKELYWRAAAVALAAGLAVTLYFNWRIDNNAQILLRSLANQIISEDARKLAPGIAGFEFASATRMALTPTQPGQPVDACVYLSSDNTSVLLVGLRLDALDEQIHIRVSRADGIAGTAGAAEILDSLYVTEVAFAKSYDIKGGLRRGDRVEIVDKDGSVLFSTTAVV